MAINPGNSALDSKIDTAYHGTTSNNVESIRRHGLRPRSTFTGTGQKQTYVSTDPEEASYHAHEKNEFSGGRHKPVLVHIDRNHASLKGMKADPEYKVGAHSKNFYHEKGIHPSAIKRIEEL